MTGPRFRFPLQRLLDLREGKERTAAVALASARVAAEEARSEKASLDTRRSEARCALIPAPGSERKIAELRQVAFIMEHLDERVAGVNEMLTTAEHEVAAKSDQLGESMKDRRVLDRLKERQLNDWRVLDARDEREAMDGIGRTRFAGAAERNSDSDG
ncbi:MAG: flagellar export protein FliJ [Gemmatimonadales bacterium]